MEKTENFAWVFKDPPVDLGHYFNQFCDRNEFAYNDYKAIGIKKLANREINRQDMKEQIQEEAVVRGVKESNMLRFKKQRDKETIFKQVIPESLLTELMKRDKSMARQMHFTQTTISTNTLTNTCTDSRINIPVEVRPLKKDSSLALQ